MGFNKVVDKGEKYYRPKEHTGAAVCIIQHSEEVNGRSVSTTLSFWSNRGLIIELNNCTPQIAPMV